jgi:hypothetical protein
MTKKDFELIAFVLNRLNENFNNGGSDEVSLSLVCDEIADALQIENPKFNRRLFLKACGVSNA